MTDIVFCCLPWLCCVICLLFVCCKEFMQITLVATPNTTFVSVYKSVYITIKQSSMFSIWEKLLHVCHPTWISHLLNDKAVSISKSVFRNFIVTWDVIKRRTFWSRSWYYIMRMINNWIFLNNVFVYDILVLIKILILYRFDVRRMFWSMVSSAMTYMLRTCMSNSFSNIIIILTFDSVIKRTLWLKAFKARINWRENMLSMQFTWSITDKRRRCRRSRTLYMFYIVNWPANMRSELSESNCRTSEQCSVKCTLTCLSMSPGSFFVLDAFCAQASILFEMWSLSKNILSHFAYIRISSSVKHFVQFSFIEIYLNCCLSFLESSHKLVLIYKHVRTLSEIDFLAFQFCHDKFSWSF